MDLDDIIILKDGTFIADVPSLNDYLEGLGFDIYTLANMYSKEWRENYKVLQEDRDWQERQADHYYCALNNLSTEIDELADKLATGKGGTKVQSQNKYYDVEIYKNLRKNTQ